MHMHGLSMWSVGGTGAVMRATLSPGTGVRYTVFASEKRLIRSSISSRMETDMSTEGSRDAEGLVSRRRLDALVMSVLSCHENDRQNHALRGLGSK
jgi:hypothetical protein